MSKFSLSILAAVSLASLPAFSNEEIAQGSYYYYDNGNGYYYYQQPYDWYYNGTGYSNGANVYVEEPWYGPGWYYDNFWFYTKRDHDYWHNDRRNNWKRDGGHRK